MPSICICTQYHNGVDKGNEFRCQKETKGMFYGEDTCEDEFYIFQVHVIAHSKQTIIGLWECVCTSSRQIFCMWLRLEACTHSSMLVLMWIPSVGLALQSSSMMMSCSSHIRHCSISRVLTIRSMGSNHHYMDSSTFCCHQDDFTLSQSIRVYVPTYDWHKLFLLLLYKFLTVSLQPKFLKIGYSLLCDHIWAIWTCNSF